MIVGIDPGTTVGWAVIGWDGKVIAKGSERELDRDMLVKRLVDIGHIILVGTDKAKIPSFVQEVATSLGAVVIGPNQDLSVAEKREMTSHVKGNAHEHDALAAAIFTLRKKEALVRKIRASVESAGKSHLFEDVLDLVLRERVSIRTALDAFEKQEDEIVFDGRDETPKDLVRLIGAVAKARSEARSEGRRRKEFEARAARLEKEIIVLNRKMIGLVRPKTSEQVSKVAHAQMMSLEHRFAHAQAQSTSLKQNQKEFEQALLSGKFAAVPRVRSLGKQNVSVDSSVIFVDDAAKASEWTVKQLQARGVELVICRKLPERKLPFAIVQAQQVIEGEAVVLIRKDWLDERRTAKEVLSKVVEEYQKARSVF